MRLLKLFVLLFLLSVAAFAERKFVNEEYDQVTLADGIYGFIAPPPNSGVVQSNCLLIVGEDSALVVDSGQFPSLAERMIEDIKRITGKPVRYLINTHWHFDHSWGNAQYQAAYPGIALISTEFTRKMLEQEGAKTLAETPGKNLSQAKEIRDLIAKSTFSDGRPIPEEYRRMMLFNADTLEHINAEFPQTRNAPPTIGFEKELTINLGKREVKVMWLGRANTGGDAVVWVPDARLLATGDTVVYPIPFAFGSYMGEWPAVLQQMIDLKPATIVPGHGIVMHDVTYLQTLHDLFLALTAQVKDAVAHGLTLEETRKRVLLPEFKAKMAGGDSMMLTQWWKGAFLEPAVDRAYQEATGKMKPENED